MLLRIVTSNIQEIIKKQCAFAQCFVLGISNFQRL